MATVTDIKTKISEVEAALETAKRRKKATRPLKAELEALYAEVERITAEAAQAKRPVGRPHKFIPEYYEFVERYARAGRGRPARAQVEADLRSFGVEYDTDAPTRVLEVQRRAAYDLHLKKVKVEVK